MMSAVAASAVVKLCDAASVTAHMRLHAEVPLATLADLGASRDHAPARRFWSTAAAMIVTSTMVPAFSSSRRSSSSVRTSAKMACVSWCCSSRWRKRRMVVSSGTSSRPPDARKAAHRLRVVQAVFGARHATRTSRAAAGHKKLGTTPWKPA